MASYAKFARGGGEVQGEVSARRQLAAFYALACARGQVHSHLRGTMNKTKDTHAGAHYYKGRRETAYPFFGISSSQLWPLLQALALAL